MYNLISVCLASFNGESYIRKQIESILSSSLVGELLVSDDGSTDSTLDIVHQLAACDSRIRILMGPRKGVVKNFEFLLTNARGDIIFLSDQDDIWMDKKINVMLDALKEADLVVSDCYVVDENNRTLFESYFALRKPRKGILLNLYKNSYLGCCMAFKKSISTKALPFPKSIAIHDWWIGLVAETIGKVQFIDSPLVMYRRHGSNQSFLAGGSRNSLFFKIAIRLKMFTSLLLRIFKVYLNAKG